MKKFYSLLLILVALGLLAVPLALAQDADPSADPTFAEIYLAAGFQLDPFIVRVIGVASVEAQTVSSECAGFIPAMPSVVMNWSGETDFLRIYTYSDADPVMVVVTPDGEILCNDDLNPVTLDSAVEIANPVEGRYAIHVGAYEPGDQTHGILAITEMDYNIATTDLSPILERGETASLLSAPTLPIELLNRSQTGVYGDDTLEAGFGTVEVASSTGGNIPAFSFELGSFECTGFIGLVPTYTFTLAEDVDTLRVLFNGEEDTTLIVERPDETFDCNDDTDGENNLNPSLDLSDATAGRYRVFVGSYDQQVGIRGTLIVSEDSELEADVLPYEAE